MSKYKNKRVLIDGTWFHSIAEGNRYKALILMQKAGQISGLELQPKFVLQEAFVNSDGNRVLAITYTADFLYNDHLKGSVVVEDVKGKETETFKIKAKMFQYLYPRYDFKIEPAKNWR